MSDRAKLEAAIGLAFTHVIEGSRIKMDLDAFHVLRDAAEAHLATLPKVKPVEKWGVTYWSLTNGETVCRLADDESHADRLVQANGLTARKHRLPCAEWMEPLP